MPTHQSVGDGLVGWMRHRHEVYLRRQAGEPWPWTADPILQRYHFCNVYRELDRVTLWVRTHIREPYSESPHLWLLLVAARFFNEPSALASLLGARVLPVTVDDDYSAARLDAVAAGWRAAGHRLFRGAYMVRSRYGVPKGQYVAEVLQGAWAARAVVAPRLRGTLAEATHCLAQLHGLAGFMAYEVVTDLRHTAWLAQAPDLNTYANIGPGAVRGLNRVAQRPVGQGVGQGRALAEAVALLPVVQAAWPSGWPGLELRDIEHSLCEYDKYERARASRASLRRYRPQTSALQEAVPCGSSSPAT